MTVLLVVVLVLVLLVVVLLVVVLLLVIGGKGSTRAKDRQGVLPVPEEQEELEG